MALTTKLLRQAVCRGFESHLSSYFFLFCEKRVVRVSCVALLIYVGLTVFVHCMRRSITLGRLAVYLVKRFGVSLETKCVQ